MMNSSLFSIQQSSQQPMPFDGVNGPSSKSSSQVRNSNNNHDRDHDDDDDDDDNIIREPKRSRNRCGVHDNNKDIEMTDEKQGETSEKDSSFQIAHVKILIPTPDEILIQMIQQYQYEQQQQQATNSTDSSNSTTGHTTILYDDIIQFCRTSGIPLSRMLRLDLMRIATTTTTTTTTTSSSSSMSFSSS